MDTLVKANNYKEIITFLKRLFIYTEIQNLDPNTSHVPELYKDLWSRVLLVICDHFDKLDP